MSSYKMLIDPVESRRGNIQNYLVDNSRKYFFLKEKKKKKKGMG